MKWCYRTNLLDLCSWITLSHFKKSTYFQRKLNIFKEYIQMYKPKIRSDLIQSTTRSGSSENPIQILSTIQIWFEIDFDSDFASFYKIFWRFRNRFLENLVCNQGVNPICVWKVKRGLNPITSLIWSGLVKTNFYQNRLSDWIDFILRIRFLCVPHGVHNLEANAHHRHIRQNYGWIDGKTGWTKN